MVEYIPPPADLSKLNPIQRYMQKGSLEWSDYMRLAVLVLAYWFLRPYIQRAAKRFLSDSSIEEGEAEAEAYKQRRAVAAVGANDIRSGKKSSEGKTLGQLLDDGIDGVAATSGADAKPMDVGEAQDAEVKNRKQKKKGVSFAPEKSAEDKTLDWEDDSEFDPRKGPAGSTQGGSGDIKQWMEKWTAE